MGCIQHRLHHPLELCKAQLVDAQGQDDGDGETPQQAVQAQQHGILDHAHTVGCGEEPFKPVQADPLAAGDAAACLEIAEGDLDAVHGPVLINDGQHHGDQQHHIELPVFPQPLAEAFAVDRDSVQLTCSSWRGLRHKNSSFLFLRCPQARGRGSPAVRGSFLPFLVKRYTETLHGLQHKDSTPAFLCQQDFTQKTPCIHVFNVLHTCGRMFLCEMHHHAFVKRFMKFHEKVFTFWKNHAILKLQEPQNYRECSKIPFDISA